MLGALAAYIVIHIKKKHIFFDIASVGIGAILAYWLWDIRAT